MERPIQATNKCESQYLRKWTEMHPKQSSKYNTINSTFIFLGFLELSGKSFIKNSVRSTLIGDVFLGVILRFHYHHNHMSNGTFCVFLSSLKNCPQTANNSRQDSSLRCLQIASGRYPSTPNVLTFLILKFPTIKWCAHDKDFRLWIDRITFFRN